MSNMPNEDSYGERVGWSYLMLAVFGMFGAHRFYLGKTFSGILYIATGAFCGLGLVYDLFAIPFLSRKKDDQQT